MGASASGTGSWVAERRVPARSRPSPARFTRLGLVVTPVSVAAALLALRLAR